MCTVTIIPAESSRTLHIACNRDERHARPRAQPPVRRRIGERTVLMPVDPASGGTWIAASDAGIVMLLINRNLGRSEQWQGRAADQPSRGRIIPALAGAEDLDALSRATAKLDLSAYALFRLIVIQGAVVRQFISDGRRLDVVDHAADRPLLFVSSGLGDDLVEAPRRELFEQMFAAPAAAWPNVQRRFHEHRWPDRPHLSVNMLRDDARTVSTTVVEVASAGIVMHYRDRVQDGGEHTAHLPLRGHAA